MSHGPAPEAAPAASFLSRRIVAPLAWIGGALSTLLILFTLVLIVVAVVRRYVLADPLRFTDEVTGWALVAIVMFGAAEAYRRGDHIAIDLLTSRASPRAQRVLGAVSDLAVLAFAGVLGWSAWHAIAFARGFGMYTIGHIEVETWILQTPLVAGAVLLGLSAVAKLVDRIVGGAAP